MLEILLGQGPNFELLLRELDFSWSIHCIHFIFIYFILSQATKHTVKVLSKKKELDFLTVNETINL